MRTFNGITVIANINLLVVRYVWLEFGDKLHDGIIFQLPWWGLKTAIFRGSGVLVNLTLGTTYCQRCGAARVQDYDCAMPGCMTLHLKPCEKTVPLDAVDEEDNVNPNIPRKKRKPRLKDKSWHDKRSSTYVGHQVPNGAKYRDIDNMIYVGGHAYDGHTQIQLSVEEAKFVLEKLKVAIERAERFEE